MFLRLILPLLFLGPCVRSLPAVEIGSGSGIVPGQTGTSASIPVTMANDQPPISITGTVISASVTLSPTGDSVPTYAEFIGAEDPSGNLQGFKVNSSRELKVDSSGSVQPITGSVMFTNTSIGVSSLPPVSVSNFPAVQGVTGTVGITNTSIAVSNFPAVQNVTGTVGITNTSFAVSSLPALATGTAAIGSVSVNNFPAVQQISGTVAVTNTDVAVNNFPAVQQVSGTVGITNTAIAVNNFPAVQQISGTVGFTNTAIAVSSLPSITGTVNFTNTAIAVNNFPTVQQVSGTVGFTNTAIAVNNFPAVQNVTGTVNFTNTAIAVNNFPSVQQISGTVGITNTSIAVSNFPATQPISAVALPLPAGAATSSLQSTGNSSLTSIDTKTPALGQAAMAGSSPVVIASNQSALPITGTVAFTNTSIAVSAVTTLPPITGTVGFTNTAIVANIGTTGGLALDSTLSKLNITPGAAAAGNTGALAQGVATTTAPSYSTTTINPLSLTTNGALRADISAGTMPMLNGVDVSTTVTTSGVSASFDTQGMAFANFSFNVTAISGTSANIQFHVQTSDDNSTFVTYADTARLTATGLTRYQAFRQAGRYYRFTWDVLGTLPSVTFTIIMTLKPYAPLRKSIRFFYSDIDLTVNGNVSSTFSSDDCHNVALTYTRGADGGNNGVVQVNASLDSVTWFSQTGNLAANPSTANTANFIDSAYRFYQVVVVTHTSAGTRTLDIQWSCN